MNPSGSYQQFLIFPKQSSISASSGSVRPQQLEAEEVAQQANALTNLESLCRRIKHDKTEAKKKLLFQMRTGGRMKLGWVAETE